MTRTFLVPPTRRRTVSTKRFPRRDGPPPRPERPLSTDGDLRSGPSAHPSKSDLPGARQILRHRDIRVETANPDAATSASPGESESSSIRKPPRQPSATRSTTASSLSRTHRDTGLDSPNAQPTRNRRQGGTESLNTSRKEPLAPLVVVGREECLSLISSRTTIPASGAPTMTGPHALRGAPPATGHPSR